VLRPYHPAPIAVEIGGDPTTPTAALTGRQQHFVERQGGLDSRIFDRLDPVKDLDGFPQP
jgi:hypothetical protein